MNQELVSVIVPIYKVEKYLNKCIESIVSQTYKNLEIILVDDGSPDNCPAICDEWAKKDSRLKVIHKENGGVSSARNLGIEAAKGKYICMPDSDDYLAPNYIELLYNAIKEEDSDISIGNCLWVDEKDSQLEEINKKNYLLSNKTCSGKDLLYNLQDILIVCWSKLYKKEVLEGIQFPIGIMCEDVIFSHRVLSNAKKVTSISNIIYYYRLQANNTTNSVVKHKYVKNLDLFTTLEDRILCYQEKGWEDLVIQTKSELIRKAFKRIKEIHRITISNKERNSILKALNAYINKYQKEVISSKSTKKSFRLLTYFYSRFSWLYLTYVKADAFRHNLRYKFFSKKH